MGGSSTVPGSSPFALVEGSGSMNSVHETLRESSVFVLTYKSKVSVLNITLVCVTTVPVPLRLGLCDDHLRHGDVSVYLNTCF